MCNYYPEFVLQYIPIIEPLYNLLEKLPSMSSIVIVKLQSKSLSML